MKNIHAFENLCDNDCLFYSFYKDSHEAMFITSCDGFYVDINQSMEKLLGYSREELLGKKVVETYFNENEREMYRQLIETEGVVHNFSTTLKCKDGSPLPCLVDAIVWKKENKIAGYHGIIKTRDDIMNSFQNLFIKLKEEENRLKDERRNFASDSKLLMQYVSDELVSFVQETGENPLSNSKKKGTMLFFDIRNSTAISENLQPDIFASFLSDIFTDIMDLIYGNSGSVNKLVGDGLLATFGCPVPSDNDVQNAVRCALQITEYLDTFNDVRPDYLTKPIKAGIGIATGTVFSGVIGSVRRQEYTVLGNAVNIASRLEALTKRIPYSIVVDENTYKEVASLYKWKKISNITLRGKSEAVTVYIL